MTSLKRFWILLAIPALLLVNSFHASAQAVGSTLHATASASLLQDSIVLAARQQLGRPYVFGGNSPTSGFDCSGLIQYILTAFHVDVPRKAARQARRGKAVARDIRQLRVGDLLTFGYGSRVSHIGIYVGNGKFIHASSDSRSVVESLLDRPASRRIKPWIGVRRLALSQRQGN